MASTTGTSTTPSSSSCPYLDTINRTVLDFDTPDHTCSITLDSSPHIYACLTCGKYFRGRGASTPAYTHSVHEGHFVYMHLTHGTFWCLPDNYEISVKDEPSLIDIQLALHPTFTRQQVVMEAVNDDKNNNNNNKGREQENNQQQQLDDNTELSRDLFGRRYLPGYIGLNNLSHTDYLNAVVQAIAHVKPIRNYFLLAPVNNSQLYNATFTPLAKSFSLLLRNMWSNHRFKSSVDPHMFVQAVSVASNKRYNVGKQAEAGEFLSWLLHQLHVGVGGSVVGKDKKKKKDKKKTGNDNTSAVANSGDGGGSSIIQDTFMGRVEITTVVRSRKRRGEDAALELLNQGGGMMSSSSAAATTTAEGGDNIINDDRDGSDDEETIERKRKKRETVSSLANETIIVEEETITESDFLQLTLDIPEKPLFKDEDGGLVIPQEPLVNVLRKFDGVSFSDVLNTQQQQEKTGNNGSGGDSSTVISKKRCYRLKKLPNYLILHLNRFKRNGFFTEKNPTIVMFPVKNFDLSSYIFPDGGRDKVPTEEEVKSMSVSFYTRLSCV